MSGASLPSSHPLRLSPRKKGFIMNQAYYALVTMQTALDERFGDRKDRGATAVEYGLMVGLIAVVIIFVVFTLGDNLAAIFTDVGTDLKTVSEGGDLTE